MAAAAVAQIGALDQDEIRFFHDNGYVVVRKLFGPGEVAEMIKCTNEVERWPEIAGRHMLYFEESSIDGERILNRAENIVPFHKYFRQLAGSEKMQGACGQLFDEQALLFKDKINFKLPGAGGFEPHQDVQAGWARYAEKHITAMINVDRSTIENGCLEVAANWDNRGLIGAEWEPLTPGQLSGIEFIPIEAESGDAVFFDSFIPHRSAPNRTASARRVLYFTYNTASAGDQLERYYADKRASFPPDIERDPEQQYAYRV
jgi:2-aminoethylphosphonate dioxygenase